MAKIYENNWESLNTRPIPKWFGDAKFGIFIHWGLYSVPAYTRNGEYAEWYGKQIETGLNMNEGVITENSEVHPARVFHDRVYGPNFQYADFVPKFTCELFDADEWVELFKESGAKYINLVSKHHDGFCLYKSSLAPFWNTVEVGPHRDFCAELKAACEKNDVRFGVYHSVYEWWNPIYLRDPEEYAVKHLIPMLKELVETYQPNTLFTDGEWEHESSVWHATDFLTWLYNESSVRDFIVPNDRWGKDTRGLYGGNFTTEYGTIGNGRSLDDAPDRRPFEECRGIGKSFGFNRIERPCDYLSVRELLQILCGLVCKGGNFLLNIGPAADGTIPAIMQERLLGMGKWLKVNGEAIYGSEVYTREDTEKNGVYYTKNNDALYAIIDRYPTGKNVFKEVPFEDGMKVTLLGCDEKIEVFNADGCLGVDTPFVTPAQLASSELYTFKITK